MKRWIFRSPASVLALLLAVLPAVAQGPVVPLALTQPAPGIYVHAGVQEDTSRSNLGAIANIGFVVGEKCVAVIDSGGSIVVGRALLAAIRKTTAKPVCYVINTHVHPDHIFGNAAFVEDASAERPKFVGHAKLAAAMAARGVGYLKGLERDVGELAKGTLIVPPDIAVTDTLELDLGGRTLRLKLWQVAHTDNDLTVEDSATGTLWLSDLLFVERIPSLDGSLRGWVGVDEQLLKLPAKIAIAGHGQANEKWREAMQAQQRYLKVLLDETRAAIKAGKTIQQAVDTVGLGEKGKWLLFDGYHRHNVTAAYAELEWEDPVK